MRSAPSLAILALSGLIAFVRPVDAASPFEQRADAQFQNWLVTKVQPDARQRGVSDSVFREAVEGITPDWSLPDLDIPGRVPEQKQAEFLSPGRYFNENQLASLTRSGRALIKTHASLLGRLEQRFGVPREIVVAIWGRESNFGHAKIAHDAVRTLATEAFIGQRKTFFYPEFLAILRMLQEGHVQRAELKSSWAGALGQPQFLPSKFLQYAVDIDGDDHHDIWRSAADSLGSIANYIRAEGWVKGAGWGVEADVPAGISCTLEGPEKGKPLQEWQRLGVTRKGGGSVVSGEDANRMAFLLMPAGRLGPAFLVSQNFYVLKRYNESDLYALFIGHLGDRFDGKGRIAGPWTATIGFSRADVASMQKRLERDGHDVGGADGLVGFKTRIAIGVWQEQNGTVPTCFPDRDLIRRILAR